MGRFKIARAVLVEVGLLIFFSKILWSVNMVYDSKVFLLSRLFPKRLRAHQDGFQTRDKFNYYSTILSRRHYQKKYKKLKKKKERERRKKERKKIFEKQKEISPHTFSFPGDPSCFPSSTGNQRIKFLFAGKTTAGVGTSSAL